MEADVSARKSGSGVRFDESAAILVDGILAHSALIIAAMADRDLLLRILGEGYERKAWHGPNLRGVLRGLNANQAFWRPAPDRHNIWELVLHCAYWKFVAWRRITTAPGGPLSPARPDL